MKKLLALLVLTLTLSACAKPPIPFMDNGTDINSEDAQIETTEMPGFNDSPINEVAIIDDPAVPNDLQGVSNKIIADMKRLHFKFDQFTLDDEAKEVLVANAHFLMNNPNVEVIIEGHCDERGSDEYNLALGIRRAQVVMDYLKALGVKPERMRTISYGEELPLSVGQTEDDHALNRRAEFKLP